MNRSIFTLMLIFFSLNAWSQQYDYSKYMKGAQQNDIFFDLKIGYPNWGAYNTQNYARNIQASTVSTGGLAPIMAQMEVMLSNELSFSIHGLFNQWNGSWVHTPEIYDENFNPIGVPTKTEFAISRLRLQVGLNYHLDEIPVDNLDLYGGISFGSNRIWTSVDTEDESFRLRDNFFFMQQDALVNFPISFSIRLGMRYFITENFGFNLESAFGGATIAGGLVYRIRN